MTATDDIANILILSLNLYASIDDNETKNLALNNSSKRLSTLGVNYDILV